MWFPARRWHHVPQTENYETTFLGEKIVYNFLLGGLKKNKKVWSQETMKESPFARQSITAYLCNAVDSAFKNFLVALCY